MALLYLYQMLGPNTQTYSIPYIVAARLFQAETWRLLSGESNKPKRSPKGTDTATFQTNPMRPPYSEAQCWKIPSCTEPPHS